MLTFYQLNGPVRRVEFVKRTEFHGDVYATKSTTMTYAIVSLVRSGDSGSL